MQTVILKKWGNSMGVVIPNNTLKVTRSYEGEQFEISARKDGSIVLKPADNVHEQWKAAFNKMAEQKADEPLLKGVSTKFDEEEWQW